MFQIRTVPFSFFTTFFAAICSGLLIAMGFPGSRFPCMSLGWIQPLAFIPLFLALLHVSEQNRTLFLSHRVTKFRIMLQAFFLVWVTGVVCTSCAFFWTTKPMVHFGGLSFLSSYAVFCFYTLFAGLYWCVLLSPYVWNVQVVVEKSFNQILPVMGLSAMATALEVHAPRFFHWSFGLLMHAYPPLNQWASLFGFSTLTFFIFATSDILSRSLTVGPWSALRTFCVVSTVVGVWTLLWHLGSWRIDRLGAQVDQAPTTRLAYIQPNFTFHDIAAFAENPPDGQVLSLDTVLDMTRKVVALGPEKPHGVVWPESVAPWDALMDPKVKKRILEVAAETGVPIFVQGTQWDEEELARVGSQKTTQWSTAALLRPDGSESPPFRKWVPMPFGETLPLEGLFPGLGDWYRSVVGNTSKVGVGTLPTTLAYSSNDFGAPMICFDAINPTLPRRQVGEQFATVLVNQSNFVWMQRSNAATEFREINRFRALENARSVLMVANTGITMAYDPLGRPLMEETPLLTQGMGVVSLPVWRQMTFYTRWGDLPLTLLGVLGLVWCWAHVALGRRRH